MIHKIYTGTDKARELGMSTYRDMMIEMAKVSGKNVLSIVSNTFANSPVYARVDFGRWLADCECGGATYVDFNDDFFFCVLCGNTNHDGKLRKVIFPPNRAEIEEELLKRQVKERLGTFGTDAALNAVGPISRSWNPGETIETLIEQRERMNKVHGI